MGRGAPREGGGPVDQAEGGTRRKTESGFSGGAPETFRAVSPRLPSGTDPAVLEPGPGSEPIVLEPAAGLIPMEGLRIIFSTRVGGVSRGRFCSLNLGRHVGDDGKAVEENRRRFLDMCGVGPGEPVFELRQVHGSRVVTTPADPSRSRVSGQGGGGWDGAVTDAPGRWIMGVFADCVPVYLASPRAGAFGLVHAGWRGTAGAIAGIAVAALTRRRRLPPADIFAIVGPSIGPCCYRVGPEVIEAVGRALPAAGGGPGPSPGTSVDLKRANALILQAAGVPAENIYVSRLCTACHPRLFFSHRASTTRGEDTPGRMAALIGLAPS